MIYDYIFIFVNQNTPITKLIVWSLKIQKYKSKV